MISQVVKNQIFNKQTSKIMPKLVPVYKTEYSLEEKMEAYEKYLTRTGKEKKMSAEDLINFII